MPAARIDTRVLRQDRGVRSIVHAWRTLTGGGRVCDAHRRTLVACSGGADSGALLVALASACPESVVAGHVVHDLRARGEALADRASAEGLARALGVPFLTAEVRVRGAKGNAEANARAARYRALAELARASGCVAVAVAHHADDQLETLLMRLARGGGLRGMAGLRASRRLEAGPRLIRPMLSLTRSDAERICSRAGYEWATDETNADGARLRAAIRRDVVPALRRLAPGIAARAVTFGALCADAQRMVARRAALYAPAHGAASGDRRWNRESLRSEPVIVVGEVLRRAARQLTKGAGMDAATSRVVRPVVAAIRDRRNHRRDFQWRGVTIRVEAGNVVMSKAPAQVGRRAS